MALCLAREGRWWNYFGTRPLTLDCTLKMARKARRARRARMSRSDWGGTRLRALG